MELIHHDFADDSRKDLNIGVPTMRSHSFAFCSVLFRTSNRRQKFSFGEGNSAAIMWELTGTYNGASLWGKPVTGKSFKIRGIHVLEIKDGKIIRDYGGTA